MTLTEFLLARIAEDEEVARTALGSEADPASRAPIWTSLRSGKPGVCDHGPRGSVEMQPARVLAECAAKRQIVYYVRANQEQVEAVEGLRPMVGGPALLEYLALPYADHPDYDEARRP